MEDQRMAAGSLHRHHFADEYDMISGGMSCVMAAFEPGDAAVDQGRIRPSEPMGDAGKPVGVRTGEAARKIGLFG